jgi:hypothetical protein
MRYPVLAIALGFALLGCSKSNRVCVTHECEVQTDNPGFSKLPETNMENCNSKTVGLKVQEQWGTDPSREFERRCGKMMGH